MKRHIQQTKFGSITIDDIEYGHDVVIRCNGVVQKRKKKLSKSVYGTSHIVSLEEAKHLYDKECGVLLIGTGQDGSLKLGKEATEYFAEKKCEVLLLPTPKAVKKYGKLEGNIIAMFHVTC